MKSIAAFKEILSAGLLLFLVNMPGFASDLIGPTRSLSSSSGSQGELSVFSEPSALDVELDGAKIGKTPIIGQKVKPGIHSVRVIDSETEIYVGSGRSAKLSWFKGAFIQIPTEKETVTKKQNKEEKETSQIKMSEQPAEKKEKMDPLYWPLNPRGPIY